MEALKPFRRSGVGSTAASFAVVLLIVVIVTGVGLFSTMQLGPKPGITPGLTSTATVTSANGLRLAVSSNASTITVGQELNISLSIVNALPHVNVVKPSNDWLLRGVPVALWPPCYFGLPAEAAVLQGDYDSQNIQSAANVTFSYVCMEGVNVDHVIFQPNGDQVNLTGLYDVTGTNQSLGPFHMSLSFTTGGYWNLQNLSRELNIPILGEQYPPRSPAYVPFSPGEYTIAVADEWGQVAILHVTVDSTTNQMTSSSETCTPAITLTQSSDTTTTTQVITLCHIESVYTPSNSQTATCVQALSAPLYLIVKNDTGTPLPNLPLTIQANLYEGSNYNSTTNRCEPVYTTHNWTNATGSNGKIELGMTGDWFIISTVFAGKTYQITANANGAESAECVTLSLPSGSVSTTYPGMFDYQC